MIYLLVAVLILTAWRFTLTARRHGLLWVAKSMAVAAVSGLLAGVFIGLGARIGMAAIVVANGGVPSLTLSGSFSVVLTFSSYGIVLGVVYEGLFRRLLARRGLAYGGLLTVCTWYPLAHAAAQQLTGHPALISLVVISGLIIALMWLPFGLALEALLRRWQSRGAAPAVKQGEEISLMRLIACCAAVLLLFAPARAQDKLEISLKNNSETESRTREHLQKLLQEYDLSRWTFTRKILIEDKVIPHSHPVLTLSTRGEGDALVATYVHEQIHWFLVEHSERTEKAKAELRAMYPKVPVGAPDGARDEESSYLHLIVNYLEYEAMTELIGEAKARKLLEGKGYYKWIYKTVLADTSRIKEVVERNKLRI